LKKVYHFFSLHVTFIGSITYNVIFKIFLTMIDTTHIHPMLVHFPIAMAMLGMAFELIRFFFCKSESDSKFSCGELLLYFATLSAIFALLAGFLFTSTLSGQTLEVRNLHKLLAVLSTVSLSTTSFFYMLVRFGNQNGKTFRVVGLLFYVLSAILIGATGYMGGNLVYTYMIGL